MKTSAGAGNYVTVASAPNLARALGEIKEAGFWVHGAAADGEPVDSCDLKGPVALVLGSEGEGIRHVVRESCDSLIAIPTTGHIDSLNVSVAAGICLYEIRRQQRRAAAHSAAHAADGG
jgi:23S rRNA (guanosine2251-2'-O)-methyltransferase